MNQKSVFYNSLLTIVRQVLSIFFGFIAMVLIARVLGKEGQGQYTLAILLPSLLFTLMNSGIPVSTVFFIGQKKYSDEEIYSTTFFSTLILSLLSILVGLVLVYFFKDYFFASLTSGLLFSTLLIIPLIYLQKNLQTFLQGKEDFKSYNIVIILNQLSLLVFSVVFVWYLQLGVVGAILSFACSQLIMVLVSFVFMYKDYRLGIPKLFSSSYFKESLLFGLKGHFSNVLSFLNYRIDMFLLAYFIDDIAVGIYSIAVMLAERIWLVSQSVSSVLFARVANLTSEKERNIFTSLASRNTLFITFLGGGLLALISHWLVLTFFGTEYSDSVEPFLYVIPGIVLFSMSKVLANDFIGRGYPEVNTYIACVTALTNFGLNVWLIPTYGIKGAAISTSVSYILDALIKSIYFSRKNKIAFGEFYFIKSSDIQLYKSKITKLFS